MQKLIVSIIALLSFIACSDPGESYLKKGDYQTAIKKYNEAISSEYAGSSIIQLELKQAVAYSKIPDVNGAWSALKRASYIYRRINDNNSKKRELGTEITRTSEIIKAELAAAGRQNTERQAIEIEKQKPQIYQRGVQFQVQGQDLAALNEFRKIPNYRDTNVRVTQISAKLKSTIDRLWQQGFAFFTAENYSRAIRVFDDVLAIDPSHSNARTYKARAEEKLKTLNRF
jgi:tetratricopeptide (TPR) repeat protein